MKNIELFDFSLANPEPLVDDFYMKKNEILISPLPEKPNRLMQINRELIDNITAYRIANQKQNKEMKDAIINTVHELMKNKSLNFSEFSSFWAVLDVSYSLYSSLLPQEQIEFLESAIEKYIEMRHEIYLRHGYSSTTLQVGKDAKAHKSNGSPGSLKVGHILTENGYIKLTDLTLSSFEKSNMTYLFSDKTGKKLFKEILNKFNIDFLWSHSKQNKMPDVLIKNHNDIFIVEHKHMKEGGGGQDKQVSEIIDFVSYSEPKSSAIIHYVTFLDGLYFNRLSHTFSTRSGGMKTKLVAQIENTRKNLIANPTNYFVNTMGFNELLKLYKKSTI